MTTVTLLSAATQPQVGSPVALPAICPDRISFSFNLVNPTFYGQATILGTTDGVDWLPLTVLQNNPGSPEPTTHTMHLGANYTALMASLDNLVPGMGASATVTATY